MPQGEDARQRIYDAYDKANKKGVFAECDDPDSDEYYLDPAEKAELYKEKETAEKGKTAQDRRAEVMANVYATTAPAPGPEEEENPFDDRPAVQKAVEKFLDGNPEYQQGPAWQALRTTAEKSFHPDVYALRLRAEQTGDARDVAAWIARAAEIAPGEKLERDRRAGFAQMARERFGNRCKA